MQIKFPFEKQEAAIFGMIKRPVAEVSFWSTMLKDWVPVKMVVDTGADYSLLPLWLAPKLGINLKTDCRSFMASGIGGSQKVFIVKDGAKVKLGTWEKRVTVGFLTNNNIPPLLGRLLFLEKLKVVLNNFETVFEY